MNIIKYGNNMTLKELHSELSKIIDEESKTNPDILDKPVVLFIMPYSTSAADLIRCGIYGTASVINDKEVITITNYYK